jgi:hypothetical protein
VILIIKNVCICWNNNCVIVNMHGKTTIKNDFHVSVPIKLQRHLPYLQLEWQRFWLLQVFCATGNWIWNMLRHQQSQYQVISAQFMVYLFNHKFFIMKLIRRSHHLETTTLLLLKSPSWLSCWLDNQGVVVWFLVGAGHFPPSKCPDGAWVPCYSVGCCNFLSRF